jgi:hypothetical protein
MLWEFEVESKCGCLKILLNKKLSGPLVSLRRHLNGAHRARATATQPLSPPHVGAADRPPRLLHAWCMQPPPHAWPCCSVSPWEKPSLLFPRQPPNETHSALLSPRSSAPTSPHFSAPSAEVPTTLHRSHAPLRHAKPVAKPLSTTRNHWSTESAASFGCRSCPPTERHLWPSTCSSITTTTSARAHCRSMNPEPVLSTTSLACCRQFPTTDLLHRREPTTVSPSAAYAPNQDPHLRGLLPGTSFPGHSLPVDRWATHRWRTGELPCFGRKAQVGQAIFTGWAKRYSKCSPLQQCYFSFILRIIQNSIQI